MANKRKFTVAEKKSWKAGFLRGLNSKKKKSNKSATIKKYGFLAFNDNCDCFNVTSSGRNREEALKKARQRLKTDPLERTWKVRITDEGASSDYYRNIDVDTNTESFANTGLFRKIK